MWSLDIFKMAENGGGNLGQVSESGDYAAIVSSLPDLFHENALSLARGLIIVLYNIYQQATILNLVIFGVKYMPPGLYIYKSIQNLYSSAKERISQKETELEDIRLKLKIVNTKLSVRDAEFSERTEVFRRKAERLRMLRAKVRHIISTDEELIRALHTASAACYGRTTVSADELSKLTSVEELATNSPYEDCESEETKVEVGERSEEQAADDGSIYSSVTDPDDSQDCRVKIVKVTNVYKVACLKHYVKQRRVRRASQQVLLQKKKENIKKMLESWQKSLHAVLYNKIIVDNRGPSIDLASQDAMGDYKPYLRELSDSDSELKTNGETCCDDFNGLNWSPIPYEYSYESHVAENGEETRHKHAYTNVRDFAPSVGHYGGHCSCRDSVPPADNELFVLTEETSSQMAIAEGEVPEETSSQLAITEGEAATAAASTSDPQAD